MKPIFLSLVSVAAVVLGIGGLVTLFLGIRRAINAARTSGWATAQGTIVSSQVVERPAASEPPQSLYQAKVTYRYEVSGRALVGERVKLDEVYTSSAKGPEATVARYTPGALVTVHFDPRSPAESVLESGISPSSGVMPGVGVVLVIVALAMWSVARLWAER